MYGFGGLGLSEVQHSISELSVVGGWVVGGGGGWTRQTHFMVGPVWGPTKTNNSAFSATHTYIKLTLVSFFTFFMHLPLNGFYVLDS